MTYCVAVRNDAGLVFLSDSRTNAGVDQISTFRKMHVYEVPGERVMVLLTAGNLSLSQGVASSLRVQMEQHYQDNRTYKTVSGATSPCASASGTTAGAFSISCTSTVTTWSATATGSNTMSGFAYTINQDGVMGTTALPSKWGSTSSSCWILSKGASC